MAIEQLLENVSARQFRVETLHVRDGKSLGKLRKQGDCYMEFPLAVLGQTSQNGTYYITDSIMQQIENRDGIFRKNLEDGKLFGEYGHPDISMYDPQIPEQKRLMIQRLARIDEKLVSHQIRNLYTSPDLLSTGGKLICGDIAPVGPYAQYLQDILDRPSINASFSLRGIADTIIRAGILYREFKRLVTFDYVTSGGFRQAAKRYAPNDGALESFTGDSLCIDIQRGEHYVIMTHAALESLGDTELASLFQTDGVAHQAITHTVIPNTQSVRSATDSELYDAFTLLMQDRPKQRK